MGMLIDEYRKHGQVSDEVISAYLGYLQEIKSSLSPALFAFASADFRFSPNDSRCLHDAWMESMEVRELSSGPRNEVRTVGISISFLGPMHDGISVFEYHNVRDYLLSSQRYDEYEKYRKFSGHGDMLIDDFEISSRGGIIHTFLFRWGAEWMIEADHIEYEWLERK